VVRVSRLEGVTEGEEYVRLLENQWNMVRTEAVGEEELE